MLIKTLTVISVLTAAAISTLHAMEIEARQGQAELEIVPRASWGAKPPNTALMKRQTPRAIVIHHTSSRQQTKLTLEQKLRGLQGFSQAPGTVGRKIKPAWGDVPYHFYIDAVGRIGEGRPLAYAGDTNTEYDPKDKIQIVIEGNFEVEQPREEQVQALQKLLAHLARQYAIRVEGVASHNDYAATDCPGKNLKRLLPELVKAAVAGN